MKTEAPAYKRVVLKLSGEALQERGARENISPAIVRQIAERIKEVQSLGVQISIVIGGGNIWRGSSAAARGMDRTTADYMGMLATVINSLALRSTLTQLGVEARVQTATAALAHAGHVQRDGIGDRIHDRHGPRDDRCGRHDHAELRARSECR